jgi:peptidoglycan/LPS O-acetylase OafA/YrhL
MMRAHEQELAAPSLAVGRDATRQRIAGLDSIRFLCAAVVMLGHLQILPKLHVQTHGPLLKAASGVWNSTFNGPAAVIVFFIISGFCIHFPFRDRQPINVRKFYARRAIRILIPALVYFALLRYAFGTNGDGSILWSVLCEVIYYILYPALLFLRRRTSWLLLLAVSSATSAFAVISHRQLLPLGDNGYAALGVRLTWVVGLPCWMLGCWLAERYTTFAVLRTRQMWTLRFLIWALSVAANIIRFHSTGVKSSSIVVLDLFALPVAWWLGCEILYVSRHGFNRLLENAGTWSYSLYLIHTISVPILWMVGLSYLDEHAGMHVVVALIALVLSYIYFLLIERPSHQLAIYASRHVGARRSQHVLAG